MTSPTRLATACHGCGGGIVHLCLLECELQMRSAIHQRVAKEAQVIDVNGWMARTTLEMLGQAGLGYSFDNFIEDSSDAYGESLKGFL